MGQIERFEDNPDDDGLVYAPLERPMERILTPFEKFLHHQTGSSILLISATILALYSGRASGTLTFPVNISYR